MLIDLLIFSLCRGEDRAEMGWAKALSILLDINFHFPLALWEKHVLRWVVPSEGKEGGNLQGERIRGDLSRARCCPSLLMKFSFNQHISLTRLLMSFLIWAQPTFQAIFFLNNNDKLLSSSAAQERKRLHKTSHWAVTNENTPGYLETSQEIRQGSGESYLMSGTVFRGKVMFVLALACWR